jgi:hypothetical protein
MANAQASRWQTPTQRRFENFYQVNPKTALAESIRFLAEVRGKEMTRNIAMGYLDTLGTLTQDEAILALSRAQEECKFFPPPATLLELSGRAVTGDPVAAEAREEFLRILTAMRGPHGPKLRPILGRVLYGTEDDPRDENGRTHHIAIRSESTPFPLSRRAEATLVRLGWGIGWLESPSLPITRHCAASRIRTTRSTSRTSFAPPTRSSSASPAPIGRPRAR